MEFILEGLATQRIVGGRCRHKWLQSGLHIWSQYERSVLQEEPKHARDGASKYERMLVSISTGKRPMKGPTLLLVGTNWFCSLTNDRVWYRGQPWLLAVHFLFLQTGDAIEEEGGGLNTKSPGQSRNKNIRNIKSLHETATTQNNSKETRYFLLN